MQVAKGCSWGLAGLLATLRRQPDIPAGGGSGYPSNVAAYEYVCMACEHRFEERRPMTASVDTALACPNCGDDRVRRQYSFAAGVAPGNEAGPSAGGCGCGTCTCGGG